MPLQNRVTPTGEIIAHPARGTLMGNRGGMFHLPGQPVLGRRRWATRRWLCCALDYPGRHAHPVWSRGYTQLFFLDEVTALAAGHRPCAECRRPAATAFLAASGGPSRLGALDDLLHAERLAVEPAIRSTAEVATLPDGAMVIDADVPCAVRDGTLLPWSPDGYGSPRPSPGHARPVLTPPSTLRALRAGYRPLWHPTATAAGRGL